MKADLPSVERLLSPPAKSTYRDQTAVTASRGGLSVSTLVVCAFSLVLSYEATSQKAVSRALHAVDRLDQVSSAKIDKGDACETASVGLKYAPYLRLVSGTPMLTRPPVGPPTEARCPITTSQPRQAPASLAALLPSLCKARLARHASWKIAHCARRPPLLPRQPPPSAAQNKFFRQAAEEAGSSGVPVKRQLSLPVLLLCSSLLERVSAFSGADHRGRQPKTLHDALGFSSSHMSPAVDLSM